MEKRRRKEESRILKKILVMGAILLTGMFVVLLYPRGVMGATYDAATGKYKGWFEFNDNSIMKTGQKAIADLSLNDKSLVQAVKYISSYNTGGALVKYDEPCILYEVSSRYENADFSEIDGVKVNGNEVRCDINKDKKGFLCYVSYYYIEFTGCKPVNGNDYLMTEVPYEFKDTTNASSAMYHNIWYSYYLPTGQPYTNYLYVMPGKNVTITLPSDFDDGHIKIGVMCESSKHTIQKQDKIEPTCEKDGQTESTSCSMCKMVLTKSEKIAAPGHDFGTAVTVREADCEQDGERSYTCKRCSKTKQESIPKLGHKTEQIIHPGSMDKEGEIFEKCTRCSQQTLLKKIPRIEKFELSDTSYTYNGKTRTPSVLVEDKEGRVLSASEYKVYYDKGRKNVGEYQVRVALQGIYEGGEILAFTIKPKTTAISKVTAGGKKLTVTWKKQSSQTNGYQIQYSTASNFKNAKTKTISKTSTTSAVLSKLRSGKKYYVRIRTYKTIATPVGSQKLCSSWSKVKSITVK